MGSTDSSPTVTPRSDIEPDGIVCWYISPEITISERERKELVECEISLRLDSRESVVLYFDWEANSKEFVL
jgi:hypothetical protein